MRDKLVKMSVPRVVKKAPSLKSSNGSVAERLVQSYAAGAPLAIEAGHELPSPPEVAAILDQLRELLFPGFTGGFHRQGPSMHSVVEARLAQVRVRLVAQVFRGLHHRCKKSGDC